MRLAVMLLTTVGLGAETFPVVHVKTAWFDGQGTVEINDEGITFRAKKEKNSRKWGWLDIQYFDRISEKEFNILTYEDQNRYLGQDRSYRFTITDGTLGDDLFRRISEKVARPVTKYPSSTSTPLAAARECCGSPRTGFSMSPITKRMPASGCSTGTSTPSGPPTRTGSP